jgi:hypothetical protein
MSSPAEQTFKTKRHGQIDKRTGKEYTAQPIEYFTSAFADTVHRRQPTRAGVDRPFTLDLTPAFDGGRSLEVVFKHPYWKEVSLIGLEVVSVSLRGLHY